MGSSNSTAEYGPKVLKAESQKGPCILMFTALFTITKNRSNPGAHQQMNE
jgi:hypothetical protein